MFGSSLAQSCNSLVPQRPSCETKLPILYRRKHKQFRKFTTRRPNLSFVNKGSLLIKVCLMSSSYLETILRWIRTTSKFVAYRSTGRAMSVHRWTVNRAGVWPWNWSSSQWATSLVPFAFDFSSLVEKQGPFLSSSTDSTAVLIMHYYIIYSSASGCLCWRGARRSSLTIQKWQKYCLILEPKQRKADLAP